jgi:hypothetical protein
VKMKQVWCHPSVLFLLRDASQGPPGSIAEDAAVVKAMRCQDALFAATKGKKRVLHPVLIDRLEDDERHQVTPDRIAPRDAKDGVRLLPDDLAWLKDAALPALRRVNGPGIACIFADAKEALEKAEDVDVDTSGK